LALVVHQQFGKTPNVLTPHLPDRLQPWRHHAARAFDGKSDARSDIYSLSLTLYEMLALRPAFDEQDRHRLIKQVTTAAPVPVNWINPAIPADLVTIVQKAMEREAGQRYRTANELPADLQRFLADEPIQARRVSASERLVR
jgi:serine/threonine protein kinase